MGIITGKEVEPTVVLLPSAFEIVAVSVAVPAVRPLTTTGVLLVNVPVGVTIAAGLEIESEIGIELPDGLTVAFVVAVWPTKTELIVENETVGGGAEVPPVEPLKYEVGQK